jgi:glucokinase
VSTASPLTFAVLDVGGTSIKIGAVRGADAVVAGSIPALATADRTTVVEQLSRAAQQSIRCATELSGNIVSGLGISFPGPFDLFGGRPLLTAPGKFHAIHGADLRAELRAVTDLPIEFARDSEAVGVGEARHGAGAGHRRVLTVALGTGFGACLTVGGQPVGDVGTHRIESLFELLTPDGRVDDVLSASGLARTLGVDTDDLGGLLTDPAQQPSVREGLNEYGHRLGSFLATLGALDADIIVISGGLGGSFGLFAEATARHLDVPIVASRLGARAALLGTAHLAFPDTA